MKPIPRPNAHRNLTQTGEQFSPEFGVTVHGRSPEGWLIVDLPKPRVTGPNVLKKLVDDAIAEDRAKAASEKKET